MEASSADGQERCSAFPQTHWTVILGSGHKDPEPARTAMETLCRLYRQPIVNWFGRHAGKQDAEDLAHTFIEYLLAKDVLSQLKERKGRFRFFLVTVMRRFLYDVWAKAAAQKRGGQVALVQLADDEAGDNGQTNADSRFDLDLAIDIHGRVMKQIAPPTQLVPYLFHKDPGTGWEGVAIQLKTSSTAIRQKISRLRRAHWESFRDEVAQVVLPADKADETRYLYELLFRNLPPD